MPVPCRCSLSSTPFRRTSMSRFNNLRLAYRLGIAFGALVLALVVIGAISVSKINALEGQTTNLSDHDSIALEKVLTIEQRIQRTSYLTSSHLYIYDGDLKAQDGVAKEITSLRNENTVDMAAARKANHDAALVPFIDRFEAASQKFAAAYKEAVKRSRQETV